LDELRDKLFIEAGAGELDHAFVVDDVPGFRDEGCRRGGREILRESA
jgi:hypothetical protein